MHERRKCPHVIGEFFAGVAQSLNFGLRRRIGDSQAAGFPVGVSERHAIVRRALEQLGDRDREILLLWDAGLTYDEISEQTGLARGAIGTTLSRARRRLVEAHRTGEGQNAASV